MTTKNIESLNDNERKAMSVICGDCDDLDGYGFTRPGDMALALIKEFGNGQVAGGYISDLIERGLIEVDLTENEVWIDPEVYTQFC